MLLPASLRWISSIGFWGLSAGVIYQYTMYCQEVNTFPGGSPLLITIILLPALGALAITFISDENKQLQKSGSIECISNYISSIFDSLDLF